MRHILVYISVLFFTAQAAHAQVEFKARGPKSVMTDEQFSVVFSINANAENFQAPSLENFTILNGPTPSYSRKQFNTTVYYDISYSYLLMPKKAGTFQLGAATAEVDGKVYRTSPIEIKVNQSASTKSGTSVNGETEDIFIKLPVSKTTIYQGEPVVASYKLYFKQNVGNYSLNKEPEFTGFYTEKVKIPVKRLESERVNGRLLNSVILEQRVLIPQQTGTLAPGKVKITVPTVVIAKRRDRYGNTRRVRQSVNLPLERSIPAITVKPLPEEGKPSNFSGAVGKYSLDVSLSRNELSTNESVTMRIKVNGRGNIKLIDIPKPEIPTAFEAYDPKVSEKINVSAVGMSGSKTMEYLLIPRYGGEYKIPSFKFSYFDTESRQYKMLSSETFTIKVEGAARPGGEGTAVASKEGVDFLNKDILFIKTRPGDITKPGGDFLGSSLFYLIWIVLVVIIILLIVYATVLRKHKPDYAKMRVGKAGKVARKHLKEAKKRLDAGQRDEFYLALSTALWGYFADRFNIPQSRLSKEAIKEELRTHNVSEPLTAKTLDVMNRAELARFTSMGVSNPKADYDETAQLITDIENGL